MDTEQQNISNSPKQKIVFINIAIVAVVIIGILFGYYLYTTNSKPTSAKQVSFAEGSSISVRAQCFATLKNNLKDAGIFPEPLKTLDKMTYADLQSKFSQGYKERSSFGIQADKSIFSMRTYTFGKPTGYIHPPKSPFPVSTKSDKWKTPFDEFTVAEENVIDQKGNPRFVDCFFLSISAEDLLKVTRDNYLYDGDLTSMSKTATTTNGEYKAWYSGNTSFDYQNKPLAYWQRLFIYPKATQNTYFDKYSIADAYPANSVKSFDILNKDYGSIIEIQSATSTKYMSVNASGKLTPATFPEALKPITSTGINSIYPFATYYQAIESRFPVFAKHLSIGGTLKYNAFKEILAKKPDTLNSNVLTFVNTLLDPTTLIQYVADKQEKAKQGIAVSDIKMDGLLVAIQDGNQAIKELSKKGVTFANLKISTTSPEKTNNTTNIIIALALLATLVALFIFRQYTRK